MVAGRCACWPQADDISATMKIAPMNRFRIIYSLSRTCLYRYLIVRQEYTTIKDNTLVSGREPVR